MSSDPRGAPAWRFCLSRAPLIRLELLEGRPAHVEPPKRGALLKMGGPTGAPCSGWVAQEGRPVQGGWPKRGALFRVGGPRGAPCSGWVAPQGRPIQARGQRVSSITGRPLTVSATLRTDPNAELVPVPV